MTTDQITSNDSNEKVEQTSNVSKPIQENLIDDVFSVYKTKYGLWHSVSKDGEELVTAMTEQQCIDGTRFYLKGRQEGWSEENSRVVNDGKVGGKL